MHTSAHMGGVREQISGAVLSLHLGEPVPLLLLCVLQATCLTECPSDSVSPPISLTAGVLGLQRWPHLAFYQGLWGPELRFVQQALYLLARLRGPSRKNYILDLLRSQPCIPQRQGCCP